MNPGRLPFFVRSERRRPWRPEAGFTLLEVLVAVVVLSFGVLGVVGLQAAALQANKDARYQSSAARLARELGDMMRDNPTVALQTGAANPYLGTFSGAAPTAPQDCSANACTNNGLALAKFEMADWLYRVNQELPGAQVTVCADSTPYASGKAQWTCTGTGTLLYVKIGWTRQGFSAGDATTLKTVSNSGPSIVQALIPG